MPLTRGAILPAGRIRQEQPCLRRQEAESRRQDSHHRVRNAVHPDLPAYYVAVGVALLPPVNVSENDDLVSLQRCLLFQKTPPHRRPRPQRREELRRDARNLLAARGPGIPYDRRPVSENGQRPKRRNPSAAFVIVRGGGAVPIHAGLWVRVED